MKKKNNKSKSGLTKIASANFVLAFTMAFFLITMFMATNNMPVAYAADNSGETTTPPATINANNKILQGSRWIFIDGSLEVGDDMQGTDPVTKKNYPLYCIERKKEVTANPVYKYEKEADSKYEAGLAWLLSKTYPQVTNTGYMAPKKDASGATKMNTNDEKKYVTQFAIWYYLQLNGEDELTDAELKTLETKASEGDYYAKLVVQIATDANNYNKANQGAATISVDANNLDFTVSNGNLVSKELTVNSNKSDLITKYTVSVAGNSYGAVIVDKDGKTGAALEIAKGDTFKVSVPLENITKAQTFKLNVKVTANLSISKVYFYKADDDGEQRPLIALPGTVDTSFDVTLTRIDKIDASNNKPVSGAVISIKDANGNEVTKFETTSDSKYISLKAGDYTLQEISSPDGYELNKDVVKFTVKNDGTITVAVMKNTPTVAVPQTASNIPTYLYIVGALIIVAGAVVVCSVAKTEKNR